MNLGLNPGSLGRLCAYSPHTRLPHKDGDQTPSLDLSPAYLQPPTCSWALVLLNCLQFLKRASLSLAIPDMAKFTGETTGGQASHECPPLSLHLWVSVGCALGLVMVTIKKTLNNDQSTTLQLVTESSMVHNQRQCEEHISRGAAF